MGKGGRGRDADRFGSFEGLVTVPPVADKRAMAKPLDTSSGDILADRRADYAEMLFGSGEAGPAAELLLGALELAPGWAMGWFRLGEFHEAAGDMDAAAEAWRMAQKLDPADRAGAALKLALAGKATPRRCAAERLRRGAVRPVCGKVRPRAGRYARLPRAGIPGRGDRQDAGRAASGWRSTSAAAPA